MENKNFFFFLTFFVLLNFEFKIFGADAGDRYATLKPGDFAPPAAGVPSAEIKAAADSAANVPAAVAPSVPVTPAQPADDIGKSGATVRPNPADDKTRADKLGGFGGGNNDNDDAAHAASGMTKTNAFSFIWNSKYGPAKVVGGATGGLAGLYFVGNAMSKTSAGNKIVNFGKFVTGTVVASNLIYLLNQRRELNQKSNLTKKMKDQLKKGFCKWRVENNGNNDWPYGFNIFEVGPNLILRMMAEDIWLEKVSLVKGISIKNSNNTVTQVHTGPNLTNAKSNSGNIAISLRIETLEAVTQDLKNELNEFENLLKKFDKNYEKAILKSSEACRRDFSNYLDPEFKKYKDNWKDVWKRCLIEPKAVTIESLDLLSFFSADYLDAIKNKYEKTYQYLVKEEEDKSVAKLIVNSLKPVVTVATGNYLIEYVISHKKDLEKTNKEFHDIFITFVFRYARLKLINKIVETELMRLKGMSDVQKKQKEDEQWVPEGVKKLNRVMDEIKKGLHLNAQTSNTQQKPDLFDYIKNINIMLTDAIRLLGAQFGDQARGDDGMPSGIQFGNHSVTVNLGQGTVYMRMLVEGNSKLAGAVTEAIKGTNASPMIITRHQPILDGFALIEKACEHFKELKMIPL